MDFCHFLGCYHRDKDYGGKRLYDDMIAQAVLADKLGYRGVALPEHHLVNILNLPSPLQMAVKLSNLTRHVDFVTAVSVLPLHDVRMLAGEIVQADILCDGRLILGVGRGAFAYEMARLGSPIEESREKFDETLNLLLRLLSEEEVAADGQYYKFEPITVMPRPMQPVRMQLAALVPPAIYHSAKRGFHIQTTPLSGGHDHLKEQVGAFRKAKEELGEAGEHLRLSLQRGLHVAATDAEARDFIEQAHVYYSQFDNVFTGPGIVKNGMIEKLPREQTAEELGKSLIACTAPEAVDRLAEYAELGIDEVIVTCNLGFESARVMDGMHRLAEDVMPHLKSIKEVA